MVYVIAGTLIFFAFFFAYLLASFFRDQQVSQEKKKNVMRVLAFSLAPLALVLIAAPSDVSRWPASFQYLAFFAASFGGIGVTTVVLYAALLPRLDAMVSRWLEGLHKAVFGVPEDFPPSSTARRVRQKKPDQTSEKS
ncbi:MAG: hypothetical protein AAB727_03325 [Patescibacteria group bacterium]